MQRIEPELSLAERIVPPRGGGLERIVSLDSLRGVASLFVVVSHVILMQNLEGTSGSFAERAAYLLGKDAVLIFFVLSGFVLMRTFETGRTSQYFPYAIKRFIRIWPPFAVSILLSALLFILVSPANIPELSGWFNWNWALEPSVGLVVKHLLMTDNTDWQILNPVMWSLVYEMRISLIFPLLVYGIHRNWRVALIVSFVISAISMVFFKRLGGPFNPFGALRYLWLFAAGAVMSHYYHVLIAWYGRIPARYRVSAWTITIALLLIPLERIENATTSAASLLVVFLCFADQSARRYLSRSVLRWFGEISYSLYLLHLPILLTLTHLLYGKLPLPLLIGMIFGTSLVAARIMYVTVEQPMIALGRKLAKRATFRFRSPDPARR